MRLRSDLSSSSKGKSHKVHTAHTVETQKQTAKLYTFHLTVHKTAAVLLSSISVGTCL